MRKLLMAVAAAAVLAIPTASSAGFRLGLRLGYAAPSGDVGGDASGTIKMSDYIAGAFPFQADLGGSIGKHLTLGGYVGFGAGMLSNDMDNACAAAGLDCSVWTLRVGAQVLWNFIPDQLVDPWIGASTGWEMLYFGADNAGHDSYSGWEMLGLQAGLDFHVSRIFAIGPYLTYSFGQYGSYDTEVTGIGSSSGSIPDKKMHQWFQIGVRGNFTF
jgi:hypothetical protein